MELTRRAVLGATALTVGLAGCLGDGDGSTQTTTTAADTTTAATDTTTGSAGTTTADGSAGATVRVRSHPDLGDVLVGPDGLTLYMFDQDTQGEAASTCYDTCAGTWPPLTVSDDPSAGEGVTAQLETFERETGETQVMAGGWPLYYYAPDEAPGDAKGQGVGDAWWVLAPDGTPKRGGQATMTTSTGDGSSDGGSSDDGSIY